MPKWYEHLQQLLGRAPGPLSPRPGRRRHMFRPHVEGLEERQVPAAVRPPGGVVVIPANPSGPVIVDPSTRSRTPEGAVVKALNQINPMSQEQQWEYGGFILEEVVNGKPVYYASVPYTDQSGLEIQYPATGLNQNDPAGFTTVATYHTHVIPNLEGAGNTQPNEFSDADESLARTREFLSYLATPEGHLLEYVPKERKGGPTIDELAAFQKPENWHVVETNIKIKTAHHGERGGKGKGKGGKKGHPIKGPGPLGSLFNGFGGGGFGGGSFGGGGFGGGFGNGIGVTV
jgi:hypothetical protein